MEKLQHSSDKSEDQIPTLQQAIEDPNERSLFMLLDQVKQLNAEDRQIFLEATQSIERVMNLADSRPSIQAVLKEMGPTAIGVTIATLILLPFLGPAAPVGPILYASGALPADALAARKVKREMIARLKRLRDQAIDSGRQRIAAATAQNAG